MNKQAPEDRFDSDPESVALSAESRDTLNSMAVATDAMGKHLFAQPGVAKFFEQFRQKVPLSYGKSMRNTQLPDQTLVAVFETGVIWAHQGKVGESALTEPQRTYLLLDLHRVNSVGELEAEVKDILSIPQREE